MSKKLLFGFPAIFIIIAAFVFVTGLGQQASAQTQEQAEAPVLLRTLRRGSAGDDVRRLQSFLSQFSDIYPEGLATGFFGPATERAVRRFQEQNGLSSIGIVGPMTRERLSQAGGRAKRVDLVPQSLSKGVSSDHVKNLQKFLSSFPDIYPQGSATGFYGSATEEAVKKLQEKLGLQATGSIDGETQKKINELSSAVERSRPPKVTAISPAAISIGTKVTLSGSGFTLENNSLLVKGKTIITGLTSHDGGAIVFSVPADIPCDIGQACPIKIVNASGISNAKPFKLVEAVAPPEPEPIPEPQQLPDLTVLDIYSATNTLSVKIGNIGAAAVSPNIGHLYIWIDGQLKWTYGLSTLADQSFLAPGGITVVQPQLLSGERTIKATIDPNNAITESSETNNTLEKTFTFGVVAPPVAPTITSISPSYGNIGTSVNITGTGFTSSGNEVHFVDVQDNRHVVVSNLSSPNSKTLELNVPSDIPCSELEECDVFVKNVNGSSNSIKFFRTLTVVPVKVYSPNGGETVVQGQGTVISYGGGNDTYIGIMEESAAMLSDPSQYVIGWLTGTVGGGDRTYNWDGTVCTFPGCGVSPLFEEKRTIAPGKYKVFALSFNEFGRLVFSDPVTGKFGNFDLSDGPFSVVAAPTPIITVVSPNGGEAYKHGDAVTITWKSENIKSRAVNIKLLKATTTVLTIASNVPQSTETGSFLYNWIIPSYLAPASDYNIEISDAMNSAVKDVSDGQFRIASNASLQIYGPNGGENVMRGFSALLFWTYGGYTPTSINVNLYKAGVFYRTLATNVIPVGFSGFTILKGSYPTNSRYAEIPITLDIPEGDDYTLEIVDGANSLVRDKSDSTFRIISLPDSITFSGRMVDALSGAPISGVTFSSYSGRSTNGYSTWASVFTTGSNGEFSYSTTTAGLLDPAVRYKLFFSGVPQCNDATSLGLYRYPDFMRTTFGGWYGQFYSLSSVRRQYLPIISPAMNLGDVPMWPSADFIHTFTDIPSGFMVNYLGGGMGNINYTIQHGLQNTPPLGADFYVQYKDKVGALYNSPTIRLSDTRCQIATHSFMEGTYQWEPYPIGITVDWTGGAATWNVGQPFKITFKTYGGGYYGNSAGVLPLTWGVAFGSLPAGLSLNSATGEISGTPITVGTYVFGVKVRDANGVRASKDLTLMIK